MRSASPVTTGRTPVLAVKPDWKTSVASRGLEVGQLPLQALVDGERPGDRAHGPGADAQLTHGPLRGSPQARVVREAQVVV